MTRRLTPYAELAGILDRLGQLVADARRARGLSLRIAARQVGIHYTRMHGIERGEQKPSHATTVALLRWLDTTTDEPALGGGR